MNDERRTFIDLPNLALKILAQPLGKPLDKPEIVRTRGEARVTPSGMLRLYTVFQ